MRSKSRGAKWRGLSYLNTFTEYRSVRMSMSLWTNLDRNGWMKRISESKLALTPHLVRQSNDPRCPRPDGKPILDAIVFGRGTTFDRGGRSGKWIFLRNLEVKSLGSNVRVPMDRSRRHLTQCNKFMAGVGYFVHKLFDNFQSCG